MAKKDKDYFKALKETKHSLFSPSIHSFIKHLFSSGSTKKEYEPTRTGLSPDSLARALRDNLFFTQGKIPEVATHHDWYAALAYTVRDRLLQRWIKTVHTLMKQDIRVVSYLSAEFLMGPHLANALINLGIYEQTRQAVRNWGSI